MCGIFVFKGNSRSDEALRAAFESVAHRGPDSTHIDRLEGGVFFGFHRLALRDLSEAGMQPFRSEAGDALVCNGEIYNHVQLGANLDEGFQPVSGSDCEVLLPLIGARGFAPAVASLDAEFALVHWDAATNTLRAARDPIGIRPLFFGTTEVPGEIAFASEMKALHTLCVEVKPVPPGHWFDGSSFLRYRSMSDQTPSQCRDESSTSRPLREALTEAVRKRLVSDRPLGSLLSGGLDSSLVAAIAQAHSEKPLPTFAIGTDTDPIDLKYARQVARHIGSEHHEVVFSTREAVEALPEVIRMLETWDVTTIRASIGMWLLCRAIARTTTVKVLLTGEISDELFGYKYTDFAPSPQEFHAEAKKRVDEVHCYDVLRADRCISAHGLEARVPFGDLAFVDAAMAIPSRLKMNTRGVGKFLLREAFRDDALLPVEILMREKAAFSDAVGHSMVDALKEHAAVSVSDADFALRTYSPDAHSKEAFLYRRIFEDLYPGRGAWIPGYWMPNPHWPGCAVTDPSARALANYGKSGV